MSATLEREIKLAFESAEAARAAVLAIGATPLHGRRLQEDCLLDTSNDRPSPPAVRAARCARTADAAS